MAFKKISQRDARRYRKERDDAREELRTLLNRSVRQYAGVDIGSEANVSERTVTAVRTAARCGHAVFVIAPGSSDDVLNFRAATPVSK